jgi:hypothetical protein
MHSIGSECFISLSSVPVSEQGGGGGAPGSPKLAQEHD